MAYMGASESAGQPESAFLRSSMFYSAVAECTDV
jgi:hypothetical protein